MTLLNRVVLSSSVLIVMHFTGKREMHLHRIARDYIPKEVKDARLSPGLW